MRLPRLALWSAAALPLMFAAAPAGAYWEYGHQTIAEIAMANVTPKTRLAVKRLLAQSALLDTPTCPANTVDGASVWPDCIKNIKDANGKRPYDYAYNWHFQDVDICQPFDLTGPCKDGNCVSAQITRDVAILRDHHAPAKARVQALAFLIHFVGDLHQPLHAADHDDKGANDVKTNYGIMPATRLNLHSVWDGYLAERAITTGSSLVHRYPAAVRAKVAAGNVTDWSREGWQVARDVAYRSAMGGDPCDGRHTKAHLDEATIESLIPPARLEIERGGLRLAKELDRALG
jgi:hypothetical protein